MNALREKVRNGEMLITKVEVYFAMSFVFILVMLSFAKMIMRNFIVASWAVNFTESVTEWLPHFILLLGLVGSSIGISRREVIQMDVLKRLYPAAVRKFWAFASYLAIAAVIAIYIDLAIKGAEVEDNPMWIYAAYVPAFCLLLLKALLVLVNPQIEQQMDEGEG